MIIGTVRPEEARTFDSWEGYHQFHTEETQEEYGCYEVFWGGTDYPKQGDAHNYGRDVEPGSTGWYWWPCQPGCLPEGESHGPFASSDAAAMDADEWNPEFDDYFEA